MGPDIPYIYITGHTQVSEPEAKACHKENVRYQNPGKIEVENVI